MSQDTEPHINLNQAHDEVVYTRSLIPDTLYRLRVSVLKDDQGQSSCPSSIFTFQTLVTLEEATDTVLGHFGSGLSPYDIQRSGVLQQHRGTEDGRTEDLIIKFDSINADESWDEMVERLREIGKKWHVEKWVDREQKSYGRQVVRGVEVPECS